MVAYSYKSSIQLQAASWNNGGIQLQEQHPITRAASNYKARTLPQEQHPKMTQDPAFDTSIQTNTKTKWALPMGLWAYGPMGSMG